MFVDRGKGVFVMSQIIKILSLVFQFTLIMLISTVGCFFIGWWLDSKFGTSFLTIVGFFFGMLGGMSGVYKLAKRTFKDMDDTE